MTLPPLEQQIIEQIGKLDAERQRQVLEFAQSLTHSRGVPARSLLKFAGRIESDDLQRMEKAIADCENTVEDW